MIRIADTETVLIEPAKKVKKPPPQSLQAVRRSAFSRISAVSQKLAAYKLTALKAIRHYEREPALRTLDPEWLIEELETIQQDTTGIANKKSKAGKKMPASRQKGSRANLFSRQSIQSNSIPGTTENSPRWKGFLTSKDADVSDIRSIGSFQRVKSILQPLRDVQPPPASDTESLLLYCVSVADCMMSFYKLIDAIRPQLKKAIRLTTQYCSALLHEADNVKVPSVWNYQEFSNDTTYKLNSNRKRIDKISETLHAGEVAAVSFIANFSCDGSKKLRIVIEMLENSCESVKEWLLVDERYPTKLSEDKVTCTAQLKHLHNVLRNEQRGCDDVKRHAERRDFRATQCRQLLSSNQREKRRLISQLKQWRKILSASESCLKELEHFSPRFEVEVATQKQAINELKAQIKEGEITLASLEFEDDSISVAKVANINQRNSDVMTAEQRRFLVRQIEHEVVDTELMLKTIDRIIDLKKNPETVKQIYYLGHLQSGISEQVVKRAFESAADSAKDHWPSVYRRLPFHPTRSAEQVAADIKEISRVTDYENGARRALVAFRRWHRVNESCELIDLLGVLRALNFREAAAQIERDMVAQL